MRNLKIGKKVSICFVIILILVISGNYYMISNLRKSGDLNGDLFHGTYDLTVEATWIRRDIASIGKNLDNIVLRENSQEYKNSLKEDFDSIYESIELLGKNHLGNKELTENIENYINKLSEQCSKIYSFVEAGDTETAKKMIESNSEYLQIYNACSDKAMDLYEYAEKEANDSHEEVERIVSTTWFVCILLSVFTVGVVIYIGIYITKSLKKPIQELESAANIMAEGNFDFNINYESKDELGILSSSMRTVSSNISDVVNDIINILEDVASGNFNVETNAEYIGVFENIKNSINTFTIDLSEIISKINECSQQVENASSQVAEGAYILAQGSSEQSNAVDELYSTITCISDKANEIANNAKEANDLSKNAGRYIENGNDQMKNMVKAMEEILSTSNEINRIIKIIDDIAFQTNILALNAAVEASRAGESGKGFAVVADEVRNLAAKSKEAATNTSVLIDNSIKAVNNGIDIVDNTAESLDKIINTTNKVINIVDKINNASSEQAGSISQVTIGVGQISEVVQSNSATSEESAATSEHLNTQVKVLQELIHRFELKEIE